MATPTEQLEAMRRLQENWDGYGAAAPQANAIDLAHEFIDLIEAMLRRITSPPLVLHVTPTRVGGVLIEWAGDVIQHEIEINPDRSIGFLHQNKITGQIDSRKFLPNNLVA